MHVAAGSMNNLFWHGLDQAGGVLIPGPVPQPFAGLCMSQPAVRPTAPAVQPALFRDGQGMLRSRSNAHNACPCRLRYCSQAEQTLPKPLAPMCMPS